MSETIVKQQDEKFCESCGAVIKKEAIMCVKCGVAQKGASQKSIGNENAGGRTWNILLLCWFFGVHRFYAGKIGTGVLYIITGGGLGIWLIIDLIKIASKKFVDADGNLIN